jgi:hypothetical protein
MTTELLPAGHAWILISLCFFLQTVDRVRLVVMQPLQPQLTVLDSLKQARSHHRSHPSYINATAILHKSQNPALFSLPYHLESPLSKPCYSLSPRTHDVKHGECACYISLINLSLQTGVFFSFVACVLSVVVRCLGKKTCRLWRMAARWPAATSRSSSG